MLVFDCRPQRPLRRLPRVWLSLLLLVAVSSSFGSAQQTKLLTLREAVRVALRQNAEVLLARLDQQSAAARVNRVADPFSLKLGVGSGLAYSSGFPMNVGGSGPSIINGQASMTLFDRSQRLRVAEAREQARLPEVTEMEKRRDSTRQVVRLYLDAEYAARSIDAAEKEIASLERIAAIREAAQSEGRALPMDVKRAQADVARARYLLRELRSAQWSAESHLAFVLGMDDASRVSPVVEERAQPATPSSVAEATARALKESTEMARLSTQLAANQFRKKAASSARWPVIRMVSQYSMFSRFNNYDDFYNRFERHNGQIGASFELPIFVGSAARSEATESDIEAERLRVQSDTARRRVALQAGERFRELEDARALHEVAEIELDAARERVSVLLARVREGKASLTEMEEARVDEARRWAEYFRSHAARERAAYELLHETGELIAVFQ